MSDYTIRTQDNRGDWIARLSRAPWYQPLMIGRWRPSLLWRVMHRVGVR